MDSPNDALCSTCRRIFEVPIVGWQKDSKFGLERDHLHHKSLSQLVCAADHGCNLCLQLLDHFRRDSIRGESFISGGEPDVLSVKYKWSHIWEKEEQFFPTHNYAILIFDISVPDFIIPTLHVHFSLEAGEA